MQIKTLVVVSALGLIGLSGCTSVPDNPYVPSGERGVTTVGLDTYDYSQAATAVVDKMRQRGLPTGYKVALGPVDSRNSKYTVDVQLLQDKIEAQLDEDGTLRFTSMQKALTDGSVAWDEIQKLNQMNFDFSNPADQEEWARFGRMAKINGILFGRVSCIERKLDGGGQEVTYTFTWRLANVQTGMNDMTMTKDIRKNVR